MNMRQAVVILNQANIRANWKDLHSAVIPTFQLNLSYTLRILHTPSSAAMANRSNYCLAPQHLSQCRLRNWAQWRIPFHLHPFNQ